MKGNSNIEDFTVLKFCCMHNDCGKEYTTKVNLKRHILIAHVNTRKFTCEICDRSFASKQNLVEHSYLHSGERPYECVECNEKFRHISSLSLHYKFHREGLMTTTQEEGVSDKETQTYLTS